MKVSHMGCSIFISPIKKTNNDHLPKRFQIQIWIMTQKVRIVIAQPHKGNRLLFISMEMYYMIYITQWFLKQLDAMLTVTDE